MSTMTTECVGGPLDGERRAFYRPGKGFVRRIVKGVWGRFYYRLLVPEYVFRWTDGREVDAPCPLCGAPGGPCDTCVADLRGEAFSEDEL